MITEGILDEESDYEDWMSDSTTWLNLADKCALHEMYSLASDFYATGISKDNDAFHKPMLWYRYAKSCRRCGRFNDAQLAVKVICFLCIAHLRIHCNKSYDSKHWLKHLGILNYVIPINFDHNPIQLLI